LLRHVSEDILKSSNLAAYLGCPRLKFDPGNRCVSEVNFREFIRPSRQEADGLLIQGAQIFQKSRSHLRILGPRSVTGRKLYKYTEDPHLSGTIVQNLFAQVTFRT